MEREDKTNGIGAMIRVLRRQAKLTRHQLAARTNLERTSITNIERGNQTLNVQTINAIAKALGYEVRIRFTRPRPTAVEVLVIDNFE